MTAKKTPKPKKPTRREKYEATWTSQMGCPCYGLEPHPWEYPDDHTKENEHEPT